MQTVDPYEDLFLFGYSCKIFHDDEKAKYIDQGKHLIPWMEDQSVMIDRYDVRGYLHDLKQYEPNPSLKIDELNEEEEKLCNEERYRSLRPELSEEQLYQQEELKRFHAAVASDGAYHEVEFSYNEEEMFNEPEGPKVEEPEDEPYDVPEGLKVPKGMELPFNMKIHTIIEKTALFVSEQGSQMEIIIKVKQQHNPQFGFMHLDNALHPYYKFLVEEIKSGSYIPIQTNAGIQSEDEEDDDDYLHPSLLSGNKENVPQFSVPSINFRRSQDDSYSVLVRNVQQQLTEEKTREQQKESNTVSEQQSLVNCSLDESHINDSTNNSYTSDIVLPPAEIQPIIQKMAEYVARNGEDFECVVKSKNDKRFEFLQPTSKYYKYYIQVRNASKQQFHPPPVEENPISCSTEQAAASESYAVNSNDVTTSFQNDARSTHPTKVLQTKSMKVLKGPISFSLKAKDAVTAPSKELKISLLLEDSDENSNEETPKEEREVNRRKKSVADKQSHSSSRHDSVRREEKSKLTHDMEAKIAEERMKDKLLSATREKLKKNRLEMKREKREKQLKKEEQLQLEQQRKEKELQLERRKKAALFVNMLRMRNPELDTTAGKLGADKKAKENGVSHTKSQQSEFNQLRRKCC